MAQGRRPGSKNLPKEITAEMLQWLDEHAESPYDKESALIDRLQTKHPETQLSRTQINDWLVNARRRYWPKIAVAKGMYALKEKKRAGKYLGIKEEKKTVTDMDQYIILGTPYNLPSSSSSSPSPSSPSSSTSLSSSTSSLPSTTSSSSSSARLTDLEAAECLLRLQSFGK